MIIIILFISQVIQAQANDNCLASKNDKSQETEIIGKEVLRLLKKKS